MTVPGDVRPAGRPLDLGRPAVSEPWHQPETFWAGLGAGDGTRTYEIAGEDYISNVEIKEEAGGVYMYLPVNTDIEEVEVVTADPETTQQLREQLQSLDTFVPGEHILRLPERSIHVIIDGIER